MESIVVSWAATAAAFLSASALWQAAKLKVSAVAANKEVRRFIKLNLK
jgi:hypothetical protein